MWEKVRLPLIISVVGIFAVALLLNLKPKPQADLSDKEETPRVKVEVQQAVPEKTNLTVKSQGTVAPKREIDLVAQVSGQVQTVESVFVDGGFFKSQELLIQIEDRDYQAAYLAAKARKADSEQRLAEERGRARQARREWRDLGNTDANNLFLRKPQLAAAEASLESAMAELAQAQLNLERTQIRVPFDGRIRETYVNLGQYVSPGTRIATVYDTSVAEIRLPLSDRQAALVDLPLGFAASNTEEAPKVKISGIIGGQKYEWEGRITRTDASVDVNSRMYFAVAEVENPFSPVSDDKQSYPLVVGLFVEAKIEGKQLNNVVVLPRNAVFKRDKVFVLDEEKTIVQETVNVLHKDKENAWVTTDVDDSTLIVLEKHSLLTPGTIVDPVLDTPDQAIAVSASPAPSANEEDIQTEE